VTRPAISGFPNSAISGLSAGIVGGGLEPYFGPLTVSQYDGSQSYFTEEVVYTLAGDGTFNVYLSLASGQCAASGAAELNGDQHHLFQEPDRAAFPAWSSGTLILRVRPF